MYYRELRMMLTAMFFCLVSISLMSIGASAEMYALIAFGFVWAGAGIALTCYTIWDMLINYK